MFGKTSGGFCDVDLHFVVFVLHLSFFFILLLFFIHFQATSPCHRHSTLASQTGEGLHQLWALPRLLLKPYRFERAFFTCRRFLPYAPSRHFGTTCFYQGFPGSQQLFLQICWALYWSLKHRPGPSLCLIHSNPQSFIDLKFVFMYVNIAKVLLVVKTLIKKI